MRNTCMCCLANIVSSFSRFHLSVCQFKCSFMCLFEVTTVTLVEFTTVLVKVPHVVSH